MTGEVSTAIMPNSLTMKKKLFALTLISLMLSQAATSYAAGTTSGQSNCQVVYGGGEVCQEKIQFTIDKTVQRPTKGGDFVDNLSINDSRFQSGNNVSFKIVITNTGDKTIEKLDVIDTLPQYMTFVSGVGKYDSATNIVTYTITDLKKGETNEQTLVVKVADSSKLPVNQGITCLTNNAKATDNNGLVANDASAFCVEKQIITSKPTPAVFESVPVKKIPETGPEMLSLLALIPAGLAGIAIRKKTKIN